MIIPRHDSEEMGDQIYDFDSVPNCFSGSISSVDERETSDEPRRPIGFRMPEREWVPDDPSWIL